MNKINRKLYDYIDKHYGSIHSLKILKYFLEHQIARESNSFSSYELAFNIAPSAVLTRKALIKIEVIADQSREMDAEKGLDLLVKKGIFSIDPQTDMIELIVSIDSIANQYLQEFDEGFKVVENQKDAKVILLSIIKRIVSPEKDTTFSGVIDWLVKENKKFIPVEVKFDKKNSQKVGTIRIK